MATPFQNINPVYFGSLPGGFTPSSTLALTNNQIWPAWSFYAEQAKQVAKIRMWCTAVTGSFGINDLLAEFWSDSAAAPGAMIESRNTVTATPTSGTAPMGVEFTGFTATSTTVVGNQYWIVLKNVNGGSPSITYLRPLSNYIPGFQVGQRAYGWNYTSTANGGGAWLTQPQSNVAGIRIEFSDGTFAGCPITQAVSTTALNGIFGKQESGILYAPPAGFSANCSGLSFMISGVTGTPGAMRYRLYNGTSLIGTTNAIPQATVAASAGQKLDAFFPSPIPIDSTMTLRAVVSDANAADTSGNRYNITYFSVENLAASLALRPLAGLMGKTIIPDNTSVSPTDIPTDFCGAAFILDSNGMFNVATAGGLCVPTQYQGSENVYLGV